MVWNFKGDMDWLPRRRSLPLNAWLPTRLQEDAHGEESRGIMKNTFEAGTLDWA